MRVLGVDPGSVVTGWGLLDGTAERPRLIESGVLRVGSPASSFPERLHRLIRRETRLIGRQLEEHTTRLTEVDRVEVLPVHDRAD